MNDTIDWKARCLRSEDELGDWHATFPDTDPSTVANWVIEAKATANKAKAELDRVNRACAEMRAALRECSDWMRDDCEDTLSQQCDQALSTDAGAHYHHRDEFKPIVDALIQLVQPKRYIDDINKAVDAINSARSKGLIP